MRTTALFLALAALATTIAAPLGEPLPPPEGADKLIVGLDLPKDLHQDCNTADAKCVAQNGIIYHSANEFEGHLGNQDGVISSGAVCLALGSADLQGKVLAIENQPNLGNSVTKDGQKLKTELQGRRDTAHPTFVNSGFGIQGKRDDEQAGAEEEEGEEEGNDCIEKDECSDWDKRAPQEDEGEGEGEGEGAEDCSAGECAPMDKRSQSQLNKDLKGGADYTWPEDGIRKTGNTIHQQGTAAAAAGNTVEGVTVEADRQFGVMAGAEKYHSGEFVNAVGV